MSNLPQAIWVELLKARRSSMPLFTLLGFSLAPMAGGFFMYIMKDPERARTLGIISAKAQILAGTADWPTYLGFLAQATAIGGMILVSFITSWVFGREYSDHTIKDLLALPTPRYVIVLAKFVLILIWSTILMIIIYGLGLVVGSVLVLPLASADLFWQGTITIIITAVLTIPLATPIAFFASVGHGYLPPMGATILAVIFAQIIAATGWGGYFPWSIPALYAGMAGPEFSQLGSVNIGIVVLTSLSGIIGTFLWWEFADQTF